MGGPACSFPSCTRTRLRAPGGWGARARPATMRVLPLPASVQLPDRHRRVSHGRPAAECAPATPCTRHPRTSGGETSRFAHTTPYPWLSVIPLTSKAHPVARPLSFPVWPCIRFPRTSQPPAPRLFNVSFRHPPLHAIDRPPHGRPLACRGPRHHHAAVGNPSHPCRRHGLQGGA